MRKKIAINSIIAVVAVTGVILLIDAVMSIAVSEKRLKDAVNGFVKENFNKAVKYDDIEIGFPGRIVLTNLNISITSDFNDNISLISSRKAVIRLNMLRLLKGDMTARSIAFDDANITLYKKHGSTFSDMIADLFMAGRAPSEIRQVDLDGFTLTINNATAEYLENLLDDKINVKMSDISASLEVDRKSAVYSLNGMSVPFKSTVAGKGHVEVTGLLEHKGYRKIVRSRTKIDIENMDLSYFNPYLKTLELGGYSMGGGISIDISIAAELNARSFVGEVRLNNFGVSAAKEGATFDIVENENMNISFILDSWDNERFTVKKLLLNDDNLDVYARGVFENSPLARSVDASLKIKKCDLAGISMYVTPVQDVHYAGGAEGDLHLHYDIGNNILKSLRGSLRVHDFSAKNRRSSFDKNIISRLDCTFRFDEKSTDLSLNVKKGSSDLFLRWDAFVRSWNPFKSAGSCSITSKNIEAALLGRIMLETVNGLYDEAYENRFAGYDETTFLKKPLGRLLNDNSLAADVSAGRVLFGRSAKLHDLSMRVVLGNGLLLLQGFKVSGYGADYALDMQSIINTDHPAISVKGSFRNFNLGDFEREYGASSVIAGLLSGDLDYQCNGFAMYHLLTNAKADLRFQLDSGFLNGTVLQKDMVKFLGKYGYDATALQNISIQRAMLSISQQGENFYLTGLSVSSDVLNFTSNGPYTYNAGLRVPVNASMLTKGETGLTVTQNVPLIITGHLSSPVMFVVGKGDKNGLSLFHVN